MTDVYSVSIQNLDYWTNYSASAGRHLLCAVFRLKPSITGSQDISHRAVALDALSTKVCTVNCLVCAFAAHKKPPGDERFIFIEILGDTGLQRYCHFILNKRLLKLLIFVN